MTADRLTTSRRPYEKEDVERLLAYFLHGLLRWQRPDSPDADMPKSKGNPAHQGTEMAEAIDIKRAWWACIQEDSFLDPVLLWGRYGEDLPVPAMASALNENLATCEYRIYRDVEHLTVAINEGRRPRKGRPCTGSF